jgi:hypothetical protein
MTLVQFVGTFCQLIGLVRDLKRSSAVIVPRTFRTPTSPSPARISGPVYEKPEHERRVEFDMGWNPGCDGNGKEGRQTGGSLPAPWMRKNGVREERKDFREKDRKDIKERDRKDVHDKEMEDVAKEMEEKPPRELRRGHPPPMAMLHGYKYPIQQPKSILKRTESSTHQAQSSRTCNFHLQLRIDPLETSFARQVRPLPDRQKGISPHCTLFDPSCFHGRIMESNMERAGSLSKTSAHLNKPPTNPSTYQI